MYDYENNQEANKNLAAYFILGRFYQTLKAYPPN